MSSLTHTEFALSVMGNKHHGIHSCSNRGFLKGVSGKSVLVELIFPRVPYWGSLGGGTLQLLSGKAEIFWEEQILGKCRLIKTSSVEFLLKAPKRAGPQSVVAAAWCGMQRESRRNT